MLIAAIGTASARSVRCPEGHEPDAARLGGRHSARPSAFGAHEMPHRTASAAAEHRAIRLRYRARFDQHQAQRRRRLVEVGLERERRADLGQDRAPRLLHRRQRDAPPAISRAPRISAATVVSVRFVTSG